MHTVQFEKDTKDGLFRRVAKRKFSFSNKNMVWLRFAQLQSTIDQTKKQTQLTNTSYKLLRWRSDDLGLFCDHKTLVPCSHWVSREFLCILKYCKLGQTLAWLMIILLINDPKHTRKSNYQTVTDLEISLIFTFCFLFLFLDFHFHVNSVEFACSPYVCVDSLWVLWPPVSGKNKAKTKQKTNNFEVVPAVASI